MQRIFVSPWTPEEYVATDAYRQVRPDLICPNCLRFVQLHYHGRYHRYVLSLLAKVLLIWIARFFCPLCNLTVSYLPDFALTYRAPQAQTFQAFLDGQLDRPDVRTFTGLLRLYQQQLERFGPDLIRTVGRGLGLAPPRSKQGLWPWLKKAGDGLRPVTRQLVTQFKIGLFKRYCCHQPAGP
jgi:hypothetical protein